MTSSTATSFLYAHVHVARLMLYVCMYLFLGINIRFVLKRKYYSPCIFLSTIPSR